MIIKIVLEVAAVLLLLVGYLNEDKVIAFEQALWRAFCESVNEEIRRYERRKKRAKHVSQPQGR